MLTIRTTGVEDYLDGSANIKMLVIGAVGSGKTRMASYYPAPIYADCEAGRGSLVDRSMPYVEIKNSQQMMSFLAELKRMEQTPKGSRQFQTVVIDTLDGYQRKVKNEWLDETKSAIFTGRDAWAFLESKMSQLMVKLLNLDFNVICNCHFKDKRVGEGDDARTELMLQLQGDVKDTAFNDFDLVGWLGTYYVAEGGERVEKRGLSFHKTPDKPFLKDRFGIMPKWVPITFADADYQQLFDAFLSKLDGLPDATVVGEIPDAPPPHTVPTAGVVAPTGGALPPMDPKDVPLTQFDKPTLAKMARELGLKATVDGQPFRANTLKSEYIAAIEAHRAKESVASSATVESPPAEPETPADPPPATAPIESEPVSLPPQEDAPSQQPETDVATPEVVEIDGELVNTETGEVTHSQAIANAQEGLGATVISDEALVDTPAQVSEPPAPAAPPAPPAPPATSPESAKSAKPTVCEEEGCERPLKNETPQYVQLSYIKFKSYLCNEHFLERRRASKAS